MENRETDKQPVIPTCCKYKSRFDHINGFSAKLLEIWNTAWVTEATDMNVRYLSRSATEIRVFSNTRYFIESNAFMPI